MVSAPARGTKASLERGWFFLYFIVGAKQSPPKTQAPNEKAGVSFVMSYGYDKLVYFSFWPSN